MPGAALGKQSLSRRPGCPIRSRSFVYPVNSCLAHEGGHVSTISDLSISNLRSELNGDVIGPEDAAYDDARRVVFTGYDRRPAAVVRAADTADVARVVTLAREEGAELAVRSGGHSRAGQSTTEGGIVLDLSAMTAIDVDAEGRSAWAQAGMMAAGYAAATGENGLTTGLGD